MSVQVKIDDEVKLVTCPDLTLDPRTFRVVKFKGVIVELIDVETEQGHRVHRSRLVQVKRDKSFVKLISDQKEEKLVSTAIAKTKKKIARTPKKPAVKLDLRKLSTEGEIWAMEVNFDHENVKAVAYCQILKSGRRCRYFNLYNGRMGADQKFRTYTLKGKDAAEKKRVALKKKGYKLKHKAK